MKALVRRTPLRRPRYPDGAVYRSVESGRARPIAAPSATFREPPRQITR